MRFVLSAAATLAAIGISSAAPAPRNAPAPAPAPAPVAEPAPAPVQYSAPAPTYTAPASVESDDSRAPLAPVSDAIHFNNPARTYSIGEILVTPHRWYGREAAAIEVSALDSTAAGIAILNPLFVAFSNETAGAAPGGLPAGGNAAKPANVSDGRIAVGYMTPAWAAALDLAFFQITRDPADDAAPEDQATTASYGMDRLGAFGSMAFGDASLYGRADWVTGNSGSWSMKNYSSRDWDFGLRAGYRTYVPGSEGLAYDAYASYVLNYYRPSGQKETYTNHLTVGLDYGTRRTRDDIQFLWGANSFVRYTDGKGGSVTSPDYTFALATQPNLSLEILAFKRWTLKGGAGMQIAYNLNDTQAGDKSNLTRTLWTFEPDAQLGLRFAKGRWAAEAEATDLISQGPWFITGAGAPPVRFAITCDFGR